MLLSGWSQNFYHKFTVVGNRTPILTEYGYIPLEALNKNTKLLSWNGDLDNPSLTKSKIIKIKRKAIECDVYLIQTRFYRPPLKLLKQNKLLFFKNNKYFWNTLSLPFIASHVVSVAGFDKEQFTVKKYENIFKDAYAALTNYNDVLQNSYSDNINIKIRNQIIPRTIFESQIDKECRNTNFFIGLLNLDIEEKEEFVKRIKKNKDPVFIHFLDTANFSEFVSNINYSATYILHTNYYPHPNIAELNIKRGKCDHNIKKLPFTQYPTQHNVEIIYKIITESPTITLAGLPTK